MQNEFKNKITRN